MDDNEDLAWLKPELFAVRALEMVELVGEEDELVWEIQRALKRDEGKEEAVVKAAEELRKVSGKSVRAAEWSEVEGLLHFRGKIYVPNLGSLRRCIVELHHDTKVAGHAGQWKTLELISRNFWWPQMSRYIGTYVKTCDLCLRTKTPKQLPTGHLEPLEVPQECWEVVSMDMIGELPEAHGFDAIMVVVDHLSKRAHFIPTTTTRLALGVARLYLWNVWKLHGLPQKAVSDRGPQFVVEVTRELSHLLGIKVAPSTGYHP